MFKKFIGKHSQVPPQYSAVKVNGKRAYKLARNNQKFSIRSKEVFIKSRMREEIKIRMSFLLLWNVLQELM